MSHPWGSPAAIYAIDKRGAELCTAMSIAGFGFDRFRAREFLALLEGEEAGARMRLNDAVGRRVSALSIRDLSKAFFTELRAPVFFRSELTGNPSLGVDAMRAYAACASEQLRIAALAVLEVRRARKVRSTYVRRPLEDLADDGRIHPTWNNCGPVSGRWSCQDPNLQNLPRPANDPTAFLGGIRSLYKAEEGFLIVSYDKCLAPGTRLLKADLTWAPIETLQEGDELIGFDERIGRHCNNARGTRVLRTKRLLKPCYRITTDRGSMIASEDHMWVQRAGGSLKRGSKWARTDALQPGDKIAHFIEPWETDDSRDGGYLAGFLDGEGWISTDRLVGLGQNVGPTRDYVLDLLRKRGFELGSRIQKVGTQTGTRGYKRTKDFDGMWFRNGDGIRAVGSLRPQRLLDKARTLWEGRRMWGKAERYRPSTVLSVEALGEREVVAIETDSHTFIAEGHLSHNCQLEMRVAAYASGDPQMISACESKDLHSGNALVIFGAAFPAAEYYALKDAAKHNALDAAGEERFAFLDGLRTLAKSAGFAVCYMANAETVYSRIVADGKGHLLPNGLRSVEAMLSKLRRGFAVYFDWQEDRRLAAIRSGYTDEPVTGRRRWLGHDPSSTECANHPIQGGAAGIMNLELPRIVDRMRREVPKARLIAQVHDAGYFEVPAREKDIDAAKRIIAEEGDREVLMHSSGLKAKFPSDIKVTERMAA